MNTIGGFCAMYAGKVRTDPVPLRVVKSSLPKRANAGQGTMARKLQSLYAFPFTR
jgi:hypothetical protein